MKTSSIVLLILLFWMSATPIVAMRGSRSKPYWLMELRSNG